MPSQTFKNKKAHVHYALRICFYYYSRRIKIYIITASLKRNLHLFSPCYVRARDCNLFDDDNDFKAETFICSTRFFLSSFGIGGFNSKECTNRAEVNGGA